LKKVVTQLDIAKEANVSRELVSVVLNGKDPNNKRCRKDVQEKIEKIAKRLNYRTNRSALFMKEKRHGSFGILAKDIGGEIQPRLFSLILPAARDYNRTLLLEQLPENLDERIIILDDSVVDGVIIFSEMPKEIMKKLDALYEEVLYFNTNKREGADVITIDDEKAGYAAAKKLIDAGRTKLVYINWMHQKSNHYSVSSRLKGIQLCCKEHGVDFVKDIRIEDIPTYYVYNEQVEEFICEKIRELDIDGVVLHADLIAPAFYNAVSSLGKRIPDDYSVVSFNNSNVSYSLKPKLSSFGLNDEETAKLIIKRMADLVDGKKDMERIKLPLELFEGKSV
jgi:LacI family transcriptional regulator